ncbi:MAG: 2-hydroxychromene-2-carboxylate isomerase [Pseudomonadota bacterium]
MAKSFEFFFDYTSPTAYLAWHALPKLLEETGADVELRPMFLGGVMQATGNRPPGTVPAKGAYMGRDLQRCAKRIGVEVHSNPYFPVNTLKALRATVGLGDEDKAAQKAFIGACFDQSWGVPEPKNLGSEDDLRRVAEIAGVDPDHVAALAGDATMKARLKEATDEAVERGAFGAPSFFVGDELFFGHDRMDYVAEAVAA